jgi:hypothetical protein
LNVLAAAQVAFSISGRERAACAITHLRSSSVKYPASANELLFTARDTTSRVRILVTSIAGKRCARIAPIRRSPS